MLAAQGEGLASLCFRTGDIAKMHRRLDRLTLKPDADRRGRKPRRDQRAPTLSWKRTRAATEATRGVRLFFLERDKERPLSVRTTTGSITAMDHVVVSTSDPERAAALYGARLGLDMALDRSHPDWGRLMFFRCGDLIVEVTHRPGKAGPQDAVSRTGCAACAGASPTSTPPMRGSLRPASTSRRSAPAASRARG